MKRINQWQCWLRGLWRSLPFFFTGYSMSGHNLIDTEKHENCTVEISYCETCGKMEMSWHKKPPLIKQTFQPRITKKKAKTGLTYCPVTDKVGYPEALAKLKAERLKKRTENGYLRAYHCEFCPKWHLTHHKNKLTMH